MDLKEELEKLNQTLVIKRAFEGGCFFVAQRENTIAPFIVGGWSDKDGIYEGFMACTDEQSAINVLMNL